MSSFTNQIIANIKRTTTSNDNYLSSENVVCIDTSNNRIGINTKTPQFSIDISGMNIIRAYKGQFNIINISQVTTEKGDFTDISATNIADISYIIANFIHATTISGTTLTISTIRAEHIDISKQFIFEFSSNILDASQITANTITCNENIVIKNDLTVNENINVKTINLQNLNVPTATISGLTLDVSLLTPYAKINELDASVIDVSTITCNDASFDNITITAN